MFGGLEIKSKSSSEEAPANATGTDTGGANPPGAAGSNGASAFSFLQPNAAETTQDAPPSSGFSFMNSVLAGQRAEDEPAAPALPTSGFSFLSPTTANNEEPEATDTTTDPAPVAPTSSFSFLQQQTSPPVETVVAPAVVDPSGSAAAASAEAGADEVVVVSSGFSFLSSPSGASGGNTGLMAGDISTVSTMSRESPVPPDLALTGGGGSGGGEVFSSSAAATDLLGTSNVNPSAPVGSGVVFGGATALQGMQKKKKRTRTSRVGAGATVSSPPPHVQQQRPPIHPTTTVSEVSTRDNNIPVTATTTREAAVEATRRAEEFIMQQNRKDQLQQENEAATTISAPSSSSLALPSYEPSLVDPGLRGSKSFDDDDSVVKAAKAAAEEAQQMSSSRRSFGDRMGLTSIFRSTSRSSPPTGSSSQLSTGSAHSTGASPKPQKKIISNSSQASNSSHSNREDESPADRLRREQEEVQRAMAERQLKLMKEREAENSEVASTSGNESSSLPHYGAKPIAVIPVPEPPSKSKPASFTISASFAPAVAKTAPPPPPPRKPKSDMERFEDMMKDFRVKVTHSMEEVKRLRQHRSGLLEERFVTVAKERLAIQQKAQAESQQMAAAEAEDFELADRLGTVIESHEREKIEFAAILGNIGLAIKQLDSQKQQLVDGVTRCFQEMKDNLKEFQQAQMSLDSEDATEALKRFSTVSKQLSAENDRLQQDLKHLERDAELVAVERKDVEDAISEQAGVFEKLRDKARANLAEVEIEIEELRKKLAAKQALAAELRTEAAGHDEQILKVRVKFSRQLARVQTKEMSINDNKEEWESEKKAYESQKERHEAEVAAHSEAMLARDKLLDLLCKEIDMADTFESIVAREIGFEISSKQPDGSDDDLAQMQAEVVKCEAAVSEAKEVLNAAAASLSSLEMEKSALVDRIPELEEAKKEAAGRRDFKEAGKCSKQIKEAQTRLNECEEELAGAALDKKTSAEEELAKLEKELIGKREIANQKEKEAGIAAMQHLADNIKRLLATKNTICAGARRESIQGVGAFVLDVQIEALQMEGQTYGEKFGGWDALMADVDLDFGTPEEEAASAEEEMQKSGRVSLEQHESTVVQPAGSEENGEVSVTAEEVPVVKDVAMAEFRELTNRIKLTNEAIDAAAENEDYEKAAELEETLQILLEKVQCLNLSDEEMATALASDDPVGSDAGNSHESDSHVAAEASDDINENADSINPDRDPVDPAGCEQLQEGDAEVLVEKEENSDGTPKEALHDDFSDDIVREDDLGVTNSDLEDRYVSSDDDL